MTNEATGVLAPRALTRPEHTLSRKDLSNGALRVLYRLHRAGYLAYLVGGGVRDLLLGRRPKDFDVVTNARPEEIRGDRAPLPFENVNGAPPRRSEGIWALHMLLAQSGDLGGPQFRKFLKNNNLRNRTVTPILSISEVMLAGRWITF